MIPLFYSNSSAARERANGLARSPILRNQRESVNRWAGQ